MLKQLKLHNFKAFQELNVEFKPITLLLGPNNSGKSSILAALRILVQTTESNDSTIPILLNGIFGDFGTYRDVVYQNHRGRPIGITLSLYPDRFFNQNEELMLDDWCSPKNSFAGIDLKFAYRSGRREIILKNSDLFLDKRVLISTEYSEETERQLVTRLLNKNIPTTYKSSISRGIRFFNFLPRNVHFYRREREGAVSEFFNDFKSQDINNIGRISQAIYSKLSNVEYIGAMRVPPERTYLFTGERRRRIGSSGERASNILVMDNARRGAKSKNILPRVSNWLSKAEIASEIIIKTISDRHFEIKIEHPITHETQNIADVGYGNSQIIPVLVGGFNLSSGSVYLVEEPEIHLHPKAQAELGDFFLDLYHNHIQSIIETHSEYLVLRLQQHIARGDIPADHVRIYYIYANEDKKTAVPLELDSKGRFIDDWPEGFFPERLSEAETLSKIRYQQEPFITD